MSKSYFVFLVYLMSCDSSGLWRFWASDAGNAFPRGNDLPVVLGQSQEGPTPGSRPFCFPNTLAAVGRTEVLHYTPAPSAVVPGLQSCTTHRPSAVVPGRRTL